MKKAISIFLIVFLLAIPLISLTAAAQENAGLVPRYNNVTYANTTVSISSSGTMTITNTYTGVAQTTKATITTYIERKFLGLFWTRVDIGTTNDEWVDTVYSDNGNIAHTHKLNNTGTYRVTSTFKVYGNNGTVDEIVKQITKEY